MRAFLHALTVAALAALAALCPAQEPQMHESESKILSAKSAYFDDQSGVPAVGDKALEKLKKWGRFTIVKNLKQADLIFLLTADPYRGGYIIHSGGQTGTIQKNGNIEPDSVPNYNKAAPVRYVYLTVIDPRTGEGLWSDSHAWGGLLTGFHSAGERLIKEFRKQIEK